MAFKIKTRKTSTAVGPSACPVELILGFLHAKSILTSKSSSTGSSAPFKSAMPSWAPVALKSARMEDNLGNREAPHLPPHSLAQVAKFISDWKVRTEPFSRSKALSSVPVNLNSMKNRYDASSGTQRPTSSARANAGAQTTRLCSPVACASQPWRPHSICALSTPKGGIMRSPLSITTNRKSV